MRALACDREYMRDEMGALDGGCVPDWINIKSFNRDSFLKAANGLKSKGLYTVCFEANCPNRYECLSNGNATFMILGNVCTRHCLYCNVRGIDADGSLKIDPDEPRRVAEAVAEMRINHAVVTCVSRDDLEDGGANQFVKTVREIRKRKPGCRIELLVSDFSGNWHALQEVVAAKPDILNHNIETVKRLFRKLRPLADYGRSIQVLKKIKEMDESIITKSGIMVGLGEEIPEIIATMKDLREAGCDMLTIGQYLQPSPRHAAVVKYYSPYEFKSMMRSAYNIGFSYVLSGPLIRSSYHAKTYRCIS